jgi:diguanylate cyclase (GGDEF)-like protein
MTTSPEETHNIRQIRQAQADTRVLAPLAPPRAAGFEACLVHIHPMTPSTGRRYPVAADPVVIGRDCDCGVPVPDGAVSREHARIVRRADGGYAVEDLKSTNGTFVNDARVEARALADGDYLRVGACIYRFLAGGNVEAEYHEEIHRLAVLDPLTGAYNRRSLDDFLAREVERARRHRRPLAVALFDIDHFRAVNETFGHRGGDVTLKDVADRLRAQTRKDEFFARYGGEEFATVLPETDLEGAVVYAERARRAVADAPFAFEGRPYTVTVSGGVGVLPVGAELSAADLFQRADGRLYQAKREGRNRVVPMARIGGGSGAVHTPPPRPQQGDRRSAPPIPGGDR